MKANEDFYAFDEEYRNTIATVDEEGKRVWVYPKKPSGWYHRLRIVVTLILLSLFFLGPFIRIDDQPFLLFNIFERRFILFGQVFWPQDFFLLALTLITFFVFVILFTVSFGRLWCGWACPQTLFMEMVFRKIEYLLEGDAPKQRRLNAAPWTFEKILRKGTKQIIFLSISIVIAHVAMAYLIGTDRVAEIVRQSPAEHPMGFLGLLGFTSVFYGVFAWFREQACIAVCPYGRLQGVLLTKDSMVVAYDWLRGEPRTKLKKSPMAQETKGDCIDCKLCVHVCPTGIDIRNGTQLECVNCTACMDSCNDVMQKIGKPTGLIRYASHNSIKRGVSRVLNFRTIAYAGVLFALLSVSGYFIFTRSDIETTILKAPGTLYTTSDDGQVTNVYNIEFVNKTFNDIELKIKSEFPDGTVIRLVGDQKILVKGEGLLNRMIIVKIPPEKLSSVKMKIRLGIFSGEKKIETIEARFIGPIKIKREAYEF